ncbi:S8 family serine peptidase [Viridibacillus sp. YIM B01967]|uniref:S8 family serine peptidase n=1 Tax=Viridibacillus soli TaxID=2798301 RepID=A0ABS1HCU9_9BACL|nr:S8 family serine peptidase [Viridibacillus soli]MBK3497205.1 S8 family serine peptidase [Viridibacillus soli]
MKTRLLFFCFISLFFLNACASNENKDDWSLKLQNIDNYVIEDHDKKTKIAILDSGINKQYMTTNAITKSYNVITNQNKTNDEFDHGTKVASIIIDDKIGINTNVEIFDIQVINEKGQTTVKNVCEGISKAIEYKAEIINMSLGFNSNSKQLHNCINKALKKNIILVASSGDTMSDQSDYPAEYKDVISVSAIDEKKELFAFSSTGKIDFLAPGVNITTKNTKGDYITNEGSSLASANFTGVLSIYLNKNMDRKEIFSKKNIENVKISSKIGNMLIFNK